MGLIDDKDEVFKTTSMIQQEAKIVQKTEKSCSNGR